MKRGKKKDNIGSVTNEKPNDGDGVIFHPTNPDLVPVQNPNSNDDDDDSRGGDWEIFVRQGIGSDGEDLRDRFIRAEARGHWSFRSDSSTRFDQRGID